MAKALIEVEEYTLKNGDSFESIATDHSLTKKQLLLFNFGNDSEEEAKHYLWGVFGCRKMNDDGTFKFDKGDTPRIIFIPKKKTTLTFSSNSNNNLKTKEPELVISTPTKCLIKFRPPGGWKGEFGFDWVRQKDTGMKGDLAYKDNMSTRTPYASLRNQYGTFIVPKAMDNDSDQYSHPAYLSLYPADECPTKPNSVTIKAVIDRRGGEPASLSIESNIPDFKKYIDIVEELPKASGEHALKVSCKKAFDTDMELKVFNNTNDKTGRDHKILVAKLIIPKNNKPNRPKANVVFVQVLTNLNGPVKKTDAAYITKMRTVLEKYCDQALITLNLENQKYDITAGALFWTRVKMKNFFGMNLTPAEMINKEWVMDSPRTPGKRVMLTDHYNRTYTSGKRQLIHDVLYREFKKKYPKYNEYYVVFMVAEKGYAVDAPTPPKTVDDFVGLAGVANDIPGNNVVVFGDDDDSTVSHELFHAMGLHHPFAGSSLLQFKNAGAPDDTFCKTDNIMDYSHLATPAIEMFQTWHWQWDILKNTLKNKTWP